MQCNDEKNAKQVASMENTAEPKRRANTGKAKQGDLVLVLALILTRCGFGSEIECRQASFSQLN
jgi:hypothetical protein